jgi:hypothetical protein
VAIRNERGFPHVYPIAIISTLFPINTTSGIADLTMTDQGLKCLVEGQNPQVEYAVLRQSVPFAYLLNFSIIAVHGLDGHRDRTWTADNGILWLKDLLPETIPNCRVYTYGYNGNVHTSVSCKYLYDHGTTFLHKVVLARKLTKVRLEISSCYIRFSKMGFSQNEDRLSSLRIR